MIFSRNQKLKTLLLAFSLFGFGLTTMVPANAAGRKIPKHKITFNFSTGEVGKDSSLKSPQYIKDRTFVELDFRIIVDAKSSDKIQKLADRGFTSEPSGCAPGSSGPLDMEDGLRYFFSTGQIQGQTIEATIYPGNRSLHWANDVFCEYNEDGLALATFRLTGFFFVIHRKIEGGVNVQLRPITLLPDEVGKAFR